MRTLRPLTEEERSDLEKSLKQTKDAAEWKRVFVILSYDDGLSIDELAKLTRLSRWTIEDYLKKYSSQSKTKNDPRGGSSSKLTETEAKDLEEHLSKITYLKVKDIVSFVREKYNKHYSRTGMTGWLIKHGFTFKRPEKVPGKLDPEKQAAFKEYYKEIKKNLNPCDKLCFLDAVHPEYQSQTVCGWIKKGECKTLQTTAKQHRLHFVGSLNLSEMKATLREYETINAEAIIDFFRDLEAGNKEGKIHIILDNAAAHKSRKVKEYLKTSRIKLHYLPPYSPNLNPIERLWKVFRELVLYNRYFESSQDFFKAVRTFFQEKVHKIQKLLKARINDNFQIIKLNPIKLS